ncbi:hypothetical protein PENTCL1PPCAC_6018, partial [Pristionchus entomophagus]
WMRLLERWFDAYGRYLARNPWPFIVSFSSGPSRDNDYLHLRIPLLPLTGFFLFDDIWDIYAPIDGQSRVEEKALERFEFASGSHHYRMQVLATRKDDADMLQLPVLDELLAAHRIVTENVTANASINETRIDMQYGEMCGVYCKQSNAAVIALLQTFAESRGHSSALKMTYPNAEALNQRVYLGYSLGAITFDDASPPHVLEARLVILHYMVDMSLPGGRALADDFERKLRILFDKLTEISPLLRFQLLSRGREIEEQRAITLTSLPFLGMTVGVLTVFMLCTLIDFPLYKSQHLEAIFGVLSPGMALWTAVGFLWWAGYPFSNILTIVPFLTVTIGIDDAFLILAGWRHSTKGASLEQRMGESVAISGASVTVTSVTDVLCFAIGFFSNMPVVRLFCVYTTLALFIDFFYQMTFFTAVLSIIVKRQLAIDEKRAERSTDPETSSLERWTAKLKESSSSLFALFPRSSSNSDAGSDDGKEQKGHLEAFVEWVHGGTAKTLVVIAFLIHIGVASYLATKVNTAFDMENLYLKDSPLTEISRRMQDHVLGEAFTVNFAVHPMPDFSNSTIRERFEEMLARLERIPHFSMPNTPAESTNCWTRDFTAAIAFWGDDESFWSPEELLKNFREYEQDEKYITIGNDTAGNEVITGFFFTITYKNFTSFLEVEDMMEIRRSILAEYSDDFIIFSHHPFEKVPTESAASAPSNFMQTAVSAIILMSVLVLLFVMDLEAIVSVVLSIVSICLGTVSYLHVWGVHLDAVALISTLMSIGFSVDYSAHVCYHYFAHASEELKEHEKEANKFSGSERVRRSKLRLLYTLQGVGWPVLQSGISTLFGMIPLIFIRAYVVAVFWKTVILVGILGMAHALLLLPVIFVLTDDFKALFNCRRKATVAQSTVPDENSLAVVPYKPHVLAVNE